MDTFIWAVEEPVKFKYELWLELTWCGIGEEEEDFEDMAFRVLSGCCLEVGMLPRRPTRTLGSRWQGREMACKALSRDPLVVSMDDDKKKVIQFNKPLYDYILAHTREPQILRKLREETSERAGSQMQVSPDQAQFLAMLARLVGAERCIEVGVYTGYSSLAVALALPAWGRLVACEKDTVSLAIARKYYELAGVSSKVDIREGFAMDTLKSLLDGGEGCSYDFTFLDADKRKYHQYYELLLKLVRPGGLVVIDNVLWHGKVVDPLQENDKKTGSIRIFNQFIVNDERVDVSMVSIGDGMTICRKKDENRDELV